MEAENQSDERLWHAIRNNFDWYTAQCRAHGIASQQQSNCWFSEQAMPTYYGNLCYASADIPLKLIHHLDNAVDGNWGIKDALGRHNLAPLGFKRLFDAQWYYRAAAQLNLSDDLLIPELTAEWVNTPEQLKHWVDAWGETPAGETVFCEALLTDQRVGLLYAEDKVSKSGVISGGLACNLSPTDTDARCIGISNFFGEPRGIVVCIETLAARFPKLPIVGYDSPEVLAMLRPVGFIPTGDLTVWLKET